MFVVYFRDKILYILWKDILLRVILNIKSIFHHCCINSNQLAMLTFILSGWTYTQFKPFPSSESVQFSSVTQSCPTLCDPMDCSTPGLPVHHQLLELTQTHVHWVSDAIQPSYSLSSSSPPAFSLSQHPGLFQWVGSSLQVAKVLEFQLQHQSFQWIFRTDFP